MNRLLLRLVLGVYQARGSGFVLGAEALLFSRTNPAIELNRRTQVRLATGEIISLIMLLIGDSCLHSARNGGVLSDPASPVSPLLAL